MWVDTNYDGAGQVRIFNSSKSVELFKAPSIWVRFDQYAINASLRAYAPLNPASTIIKKIDAGDVLKLQYLQDAFGNIGVTSKFLAYRCWWNFNC